jgi:hypothetical protein
MFHKIGPENEKRNDAWPAPQGTAPSSRDPMKSPGQAARTAARMEGHTE